MHPATAPRPVCRRKVFHALITLWPGTLFFDIAHAQQPPEAALPAVTVRGVAPGSTTEGTHSYTTGQTAAATGLALSPRDTPQSVTVMTRQRMEDRQMNSVTEVLRNTTGISSYALDGDGGRVAFYARGFEITNFAYDGTPSSALPNTFVPGDGIQDSAFYDRIEIVRGATGLLNGTGNPSASVNLIRKHPKRDFSASASASAGSWDNYRGVLDLSTPLFGDGRMRGRVVAVDQESHAFLDHYRIKRPALYGTIDADLSARTTLSIGYQYSHSDPKGMPWGGQPLFYGDGSVTHWPRSTNLAATWSTWNSTVKTAFADLEQRFDNGWKLRVGLTRKQADADARFLSALGYPDRVTGQGLIPVATSGILATRQDSVDMAASGPFRLLGRQHASVLGMSTSDRTSDDRETGFLFPRTPLGNLEDWSGRYPEPDFGASAHVLTRTRVRQSGLYGAVRLSVADPLTLVVGGRVSNYTMDQSTAAKALHSKETAKFFPYAGLVYDIDGTYSAYASHTGIFNPQTARNRNSDVLAPTAGKNAEVGLKGEYLDGKLVASVALFEARLDNVAQIDAGRLLTDGTQAYYAANGTTSKGVEFDMQGELARGWNASTGIAHFTAANGDGSRMSSQIPRTTVRLFTTYRLPDDWNRLTIGGGFDWQSRFYQSAMAPAGRQVTVGQAAYATVSVMVRYALTRKATLSIHLDNLLDKHYYAMAGFYNQFLYGAPRNAMVAFNYQL